VSVVGVGLVRFAGYFEYLHLIRRQKARLYDARAERLRHQVPVHLLKLASSQTEGDVLAVLERATEELELERVELLRNGVPFKQFGRAGEGSRDSVRATYPLGRDDQARATLRFQWCGDEPNVSPQVAILLQLLVDGATQGLLRVGSQLAPAPCPDPSPSYAGTPAIATNSAGGLS
jgi:hypothetical protein